MKTTRIKTIAPVLRSWGLLILGIILYSAALALFLTQNNIAAGGVSGLAVVLCKFLPVSIGALTLIINIPILVCAVCFNGWRYSRDAIIGAFIYSFAIEVFDRWLPVLTKDPLVAAVFGGMMYGIGMTLITIAGKSLGGTDLLCRLLNRKFPMMSVAVLSLIIDGMIVLFSMLMFGNVEVGLYAIITLIVCSFVADRFLLGLERGTICMIITSGSTQEISQPLLEATGHAVTAWQGTGMYTGEERNVILMAIRPREVYEVKKLVGELDPTAFMTVISANELIGGNFRNITGQ